MTGKTAFFQGFCLQSSLDCLIREGFKPPYFFFALTHRQLPPQQAVGTNFPGRLFNGAHNLRVRSRKIILKLEPGLMLAARGAECPLSSPASPLVRVSAAGSGVAGRFPKTNRPPPEPCAMSWSDVTELS